MFFIHGLFLAQRLPMQLGLACPEGMTLTRNWLEKTRSTGLSEIVISHDPFDIATGSDVVYTDVWASMGQEEETEERAKIFQPFQVNSELMEAAGEKGLLSPLSSSTSRR